ncbi:unnamed protein product [Soboliphyme baturini]|uniref:Glyco_transf_7N domain-containing protein n=1 Tax=Soboliphyme baturini TaxID=241478 RepID=A0A183J6Y9_9BILA|nr:unnamed protein product [Soboliphyme baturini]
MTGSQYRRVNGYSNLYWGWGGEDDDIHVRIKEAGMYVLRHPSQIGRYSMIKHDRDRGNEVNPCRMHLLNSARDRLKTDGLSDLAYRLIRIDRQTLYTNLTLEIKDFTNRTVMVTNATEASTEVVEIFDILKQKFSAAVERNKTSANNESIAIIIPYRDRESHLIAFFDHIIPFLERQNVSYHIFVVEQVRNQTFNKGLLTNVGFVFADRLRRFSCFVFHDVDLLPEDDRNLYRCGDQPRHFAAAIDKNGYR